MPAPAPKDTIAMPMVREALLQSCPAFEERARLLLAVGIDPRLLDDPDARVPAQAYARLWRRLARYLDDEFFAMDPRPLRAGSLALLCKVAMAQPTLAQGLETGLEFLSLMFGGFSARLVRQQGLAEIVLDEGQQPPLRPFAYFTLWMIVHGVACWLAGRRIPILAVESRCAEPDYCDDYRVMFSENLRFGRPRTRIIFPAEGLDAPSRRSEDERRRFLARAPGNILVKYRDPDSLARRIRQRLRGLPAQHWPETEGLAQSLHLSASTLRRRLAEEGQTYQALKDRVRKELAVAWLAEAEVSFGEIAERLGFADTSSFYKAFRKWFGASPGQYRQLILSSGQTSQLN